MTNREKVEEALQTLVAAYGPEKVLHEAYKLIGCTTLAPQVPQATEVKHVVDEDSAKRMHNLVRALDTLVIDIADAGNEFLNRMEHLQAAKAKGVPAEYFKILGPEGLDYTFEALNSAVTSQLEAGNKREAAHRDRSDMVRRRAQLETSIKLTEAEAIMNIVGQGKDAYVMIGEAKTYMPNDTARDAYRRTVSKAEREDLAKVNGEIHSIEADIVRAKDSWDTAKELSDTLRARANAQSALLNFLASRG